MFTVRFLKYLRVRTLFYMLSDLHAAQQVEARKLYSAVKIHFHKRTNREWPDPQDDIYSLIVIDLDDDRITVFGGFVSEDAAMQHFAEEIYDSRRKFDYRII